MPRIRTIKPDFWRDEALASVSSEACLLAIGLLNHCDDEGYFNANKKLVEADIFPLRELSNNIESLLYELCKIGYLELFKGKDGKTYGHIKNFEKHQVIDRKKASKFKDLCVFNDESTIRRRSVDDLSTLEKEKEMEHGKEETHPPTPQKGDVCFSENYQEEDNAPQQEAIWTLLDNFMDLKTLLGENIKNTGGYKSRIATAIRNGETTVSELKKQIKKMQDEIADKAKKRMELEKIELHFDQRNEANFSDEEIMKMFYKMASDERNRIEKEAQQLAIEANPAFETFPPSLKKITQKSYIIHLCLPLFKGITQCVN